MNDTPTLALRVSKTTGVQGDRVTVSEWTQVIVWIALVLVLGVVEVFTLDFIFIMLAVGAAGMM
ncbi:MAG: hypothetical protein EOP73_25280, partial [Variovorax sp.]